MLRSKKLKSLATVLMAAILISETHLLSGYAKTPEKAVDGSRIIETSDYDGDSIASDTDGKYIYYCINFGVFYTPDYCHTAKRNIKKDSLSLCCKGRTIYRQLACKKERGSPALDWRTSWRSGWDSNPRACMQTT